MLDGVPGASVSKLSTAKLFPPTYLVDQCKRHAQRVRNCRGSLGSSSIRTDDDCLLKVGDRKLNVFSQEVAAVEVVDRNVEETLILRVVQIHGDDMICACAGEEICNQRASLRDPLLIARLGLELWRHGRSADDAISPMCAVHSVRLDRALFRAIRLLRFKGISAFHRADDMGSVAFLGELETLQRPVKGCCPICEGCTGVLRTRSRWHTVERVCARPTAGGARNFCKRCASLVVWDIALTGIREEREDGGDALRRSCPASGDADQLERGQSEEGKTADTETHELHKVVVDLSSAALHDKNIFPTDRLSNLYPGLADSKFGELGESQLRTLLATGGLLLPAASLEECRDGRRFVLQESQEGSGYNGGSRSFTGKLRVACGKARLANDQQLESSPRSQHRQCSTRTRRAARRGQNLLLPPKTTMLRTMTRVGSLEDYAR